MDDLRHTMVENDGGIEKASVNLVQFEKTGVIGPGKSETVSFTVTKEEMASYDDGVKLKNGGYILEAGEYTISVRANSHEVLDEAAFTVGSDVDYSTGRSSDLIPAVNVFQDYSRGGFVQLSRADGFANYNEATAAPASYAMSADTRAALEKNLFGIYDPTGLDNPGDAMPTTGARNNMKLADLTGKAYGDPDWDKLLDQLTFEDMVTMINIGGWQTAAIDSVGMVETDYNGSYGYMISDHCVRTGNDLMLAFGGAESNKFTDQSATALINMRESCRNILYTIGNSGYYANGDPTGGMDNMTKMFMGIDIGAGVVLVAAEAALVYFFLKKKENA